MDEWIASIIPGNDKCAECVLNMLVPACVSVCVFVCLFVCTHVFKYPYYFSGEIQTRKILNLKPRTNFSFKDTCKVVYKSGINGGKLFK